MLSALQLNRHARHVSTSRTTIPTGAGTQHQQRHPRGFSASVHHHLPQHVVHRSAGCGSVPTSDHEGDRQRGISPVAISGDGTDHTYDYAVPRT